MKAIFSRYRAVLESDGRPMPVRAALALINQELDAFLTEQEGEYDADTRWALAWFAQFGHNDGPFGVAETLSKAKNTAIDGLVAAGILEARGGRVRLLRCEELPPNWEPTRSRHTTVWEVAQRLIHTLDTGGELATADLLVRVGAPADAARDLAYRLYTICERKHWTQGALGYNTLVSAWPQLMELAVQQRRNQAELW